MSLLKRQSPCSLLKTTVVVPYAQAPPAAPSALPAAPAAPAAMASLLPNLRPLLLLCLLSIHGRALDVTILRLLGISQVFTGLLNLR